jgi:hypothetical protein
MNGRRKWRAKNRWMVGLLTLKPPQMNGTMSFPMKGMALRRLVMTVAPQCDICP